MISACTCFNCDDESREAETLAESEAIAASDGWVIGHDPDSDDEEANAVYACSRCAVFLNDTYPVA